MRGEGGVPPYLLPWVAGLFLIRSCQLDHSFFFFFLTNGVVRAIGAHAEQHSEVVSLVRSLFFL